MQSANLLLLFNQRVLISLRLKGLLKRQDLLLPLSHFLTVCLTWFSSLNSSLTAFHGIGLIFFFVVYHFDLFLFSYVYFPSIFLVVSLSVRVKILKQPSLSFFLWL